MPLLHCARENIMHVMHTQESMYDSGSAFVRHVVEMVNRIHFECPLACLKIFFHDCIRCSKLMFKNIALYIYIYIYCDT